MLQGIAPACISVNPSVCRYRNTKRLHSLCHGCLYWFVPCSKTSTRQSASHTDVYNARDGGTENYVQSSNFLTLVRARTDHELGLDEGIKLLLGQCLHLHRTLLQGQALLVSVLGNLAGHVVANLGVEAGDKHESII